jgi:hypothetical protein
VPLVSPQVFIYYIIGKPEHPKKEKVTLTLDQAPERRRLPGAWTWTRLHDNLPLLRLYCDLSWTLPLLVIRLVSKVSDATAGEIQSSS